MPGLFDALKEGTFGIFAGPQDPRVPAGTGRREGLIEGGLATIASGSQDPLEALAQGAMMGREAAAAEQERVRMQQAQMQVKGFLQEAGGLTPEALQRSFVEFLAAGDIDSARTVGEILKSLPKPESTKLDITEQTIRNPDTGKLERVQVASDPMSGVVVRETVLGEADDTAQNVYERTFSVSDERGPQSLYGIVKGTGDRVYLGQKAASGSGGRGAQASMMAGLAANAKSANEALRPLDSELTGFAINFARRAGDTTVGDFARGAANELSDGQAGLALTAGLNFINPSIRFLTGAQMNQEEAGRYIVGLLPTTWDPPEVVEFKRVMRDNLVETMATAGQSGDDFIEAQSPEDNARVFQLAGEVEAGGPLGGAGGSGGGTGLFPPKGNNR